MTSPVTNSELNYVPKKITKEIQFTVRESRLMNWKHLSMPEAIVCWVSHQQVWRSSLEDYKIKHYPNTG